MYTARACVINWFVLMMVLVACGDNSSSNGGNNNGNDGGVQHDGGGLSPVLIPSGGVSSGAINGVLHVYVIKAQDDSPIAGATVQVGEPEAAAPLTGTTDVTGLVTFEDGTLNSAQTITAVATGFAATTWFGVNGANATVPLIKSQAPAVETATVTGEIQGWFNYPIHNGYDYLAAIVNYSHTDNILGAENYIEQPTSNDRPLNVCVYVPIWAEDDCAWQLTTRTGQQIIYATVVNGNYNGTPTDLSDDVITVIGYAAITGLDLSPGQSLAGHVLTQVNDLATVNVTFPTAPPGLGDITGVPYIVMGDAGRLPAFLFSPDRLSAPLPQLSGVFATGVYDFIGVANTTGETDTQTSLSFLRDVAIGAPVSFPAWLLPPADTSASAGTYTFAPVSGAQLHSVAFSDSTDNPLWVVALLDGRSSFTLPALSPDPLPFGQITMLVTAAVLPGFNPQDFTNEVLAETLAQTSTSSVTFTN